MMRAAVLAVLILAGAGPAAADTRGGVAAWERGDYRTAVEEWRKAAAAGEADAQFNLGQAYKLGRGVPVDTQAAQRWYQQAAAQGHVQAADNYGLALFQNGHARDAIPYLEKSVARGEPRAQYILGTMLFNGTDIAKDWVRAYALTSRSAQAGLPQATQSLQQMDAYLSAAERQQGAALATQLAGPDPAAPLAGDLAARATSLTAPPLRSVAVPASGIGASPQLNAAPSATGRWQLQLGAFGDPANARRLGSQLAGHFPGRTVEYDKVGTLTKVLIGPFASRGAAAAACGALKPCVPVGP